MNVIRAAAKGDFNTVKKLLEDGINVDTVDVSGRTALIEAAWNGQTEIVRYLLEHNAGIDATDKSGFTSLMRASEEGYDEVVAELVQKGADVNCRGFVKGTTPLMLATEKGHLKIIELLLDHGAKINAIDQFEETALSRAYRSNQMEAADLLESRGGRGKPERSAFTFSDSDLRPYIKATVPQWHGADIDIDEIEEVSDEFGDTDEE